jgi:excisionase family DNA binding protein
MVNQIDPLLTADELAARLRVSVAAVRRWTIDGVPYVAAGRRRLFTAEAALEWLGKRNEESLARQRAKRVAKLEEREAV